MTDAKPEPRRRRRRRRARKQASDSAAKAAGGVSGGSPQTRDNVPDVKAPSSSPDKRRRRRRRRRTEMGGPGVSPEAPRQVQPLHAEDVGLDPIRDDASSRPKTELGWRSYSDESDDDDSERDETQYISAPNATGDGPPVAVKLSPDLPVEDELDDSVAALPQKPIVDVVGVKFVPTSRVTLCDGRDGNYAIGDRVMVDGDRGARLAIIVSAPVRKPFKKLRRILRIANKQDLQHMERAQDRASNALVTARACARQRNLPIKVFRVEPVLGKGRLRIYFSCEERVDFRDLVGELSRLLHARIEMRQTGVRDEAKITGGIGTCGRELCCTTWLPEFVPVSIKMVKDQGLVLNPTKVSGQCGRLKCCLVYEQEMYAELRKGMPKLGKRVVTEFGEGRVVEVDVLKQRVRVSLVHGESRSLTPDQVKPMFPSQQIQKGKGKMNQDKGASQT